MQSAPQQMSGALDLIVRNLDFKDADELEMRLRKPLVSAGVVKPKPGEQVTPMPPSPEMIKAQSESMKMQAETQMSMMRLEQEKLRLEASKVRLAAEIAKMQADAGRGDLSTVIQAAQGETKHLLEAERIRLERERLDHQRRMDANEIALRASEQFHARQKTGGAN
jgi:hypothetical protein